MGRLKFSLFFLMIQLLVPPVRAQYFSTGTDPANIRWLQINTENFQLIFPNDYEPKAQQVAAILEKVYRYGYQSLGTAPRKISVIMHTRTVNSNGMVAWAPRRMELYPTPHQKIYAQDWLQQLAIHEFRHVVQMDKIAQELPAIFKIILGEQAATAAVGAYLPFWFLEGDAVVTETALSQSGRGRNPYFLMENKAQAVEKGLFSYDKASLGSYKDFVPNRYKFGWWMTGGIRAKYGERTWSNVLEQIASKPLSITPVNTALKKQTGHTKEELYASLFANYRQRWIEQIDSAKLSRSVALTTSSPSYTQYLYPQLAADGSLVAYKQSRHDIGRIVKIENGREQVLFTPGTILDESMSLAGSKIIWSERRAHLRWDHADRSVIILRDIESLKMHKFTYDDNLFAPQISPDSNLFAAVRVNETNNYNLGIFNLNDGNLTESYTIGDNDFIFSPCWSHDGNHLFCIGLSDQGKYIARINLKTGNISRLTEPSYADIRNLSYFGKTLVYTSAESGIDNIYQLDLSSRSVRQLTNVAFGADYGILADDTLFFSNYTADGYQLVKLPANHFFNQPSAGSNLVSNHLADLLASRENLILDFKALPDSNYQVKRYSKLAHLFNFHSWAPAYINTTDYEIRPGVSFVSQNKLGTATANLGYDYDWSERIGKYRANLEYSGLWPILRAEVNYGKRKSSYGTIQQNGDTTYQDFSWNEMAYEFEARLPLTFNSGKYTQFIQPKIEYSRRKVSHDSSTPDEFFSGYYHGISYHLYLQNTIRQAELDLQPRWGQAVELVFKQNPSGGVEIANLKAFQSYLYFPGFRRNQALRIYNGYQQKNSGQSSDLFSNVVRFPRGIQQIKHSELYTFSADYRFPLAYPDFSLGQFVYLKRLRASLFYDFSSLQRKNYNDDGSLHSIYKKYLTSVGLEIMGDGHFLRLPAPVSVGLRSMYLPDFKETRFELMLSVQFSGI
ncbi:hypothetical protein [Mangrovibacterium marinum]|uniref:WD40 repeat protein n=1 Tax=Mangrovibacterium marinum TaxID=1639118 RepID=A0A2T5C3L3_9BACT|nr:hypothetical protein [Mangrovibacterium marinum]PTN09335.1 hypothetical protein C8N47_105176 [Mangrovibacterium marinum]